MNDLSIFKFEEVSPIRVIDRNGSPWFVAKDIGDALELQNITMATNTLDEDELDYIFLSSGFQNRKFSIISESGMYALVIRSNKPAARKFRKWITSEVLPSIRKTGTYTVPHKLKIPQNIITLQTVARELNVTTRTIRRYWYDIESDMEIGTDYISSPLKFLPSGAEKLKVYMQEKGGYVHFKRPVLLPPPVNEDKVIYPIQIAKMLDIEINNIYKIYHEIKSNMSLGKHYLQFPLRFLPEGVERMLEAGRNRAKRTQKKKLTVPKDWGGRELTFSLGDIEITVKRK